jgi:hypothetical protein
VISGLVDMVSPGRRTRELWVVGYLETCTGCGQRRRVAVRLADGPQCDACRPWKVLTCGICGRTAPCLISQTTGRPWCRACKQRWARCAGCGTVKPVRGGTAKAPLCATCTRPDPGFWRTCPSCGQTGQLRDRACALCNLRNRLRGLLGDESGQIRPELEALHDNLATYPRPTTVLTWLGKDTTAAVLREIGTDRMPLTHAALDALPDGKPIAHLRSILVATGTLPVRDEHLARLERWITHLIADRQDRDERQLLRRYGLWHLLRHLRSRLRGKHATHEQATVVQQHLRAAAALLDWLTGRDLTLATCQQRDLDDWLANQTRNRRDAGHFVRWAKKQKLTTLDFPAVRWDGPGSIDTEARWQQARQLLHDQTLKPEDRVAGLLVLLYAQWPAAISHLTLDHLDDDGHQVRLRLGGEPVVLPKPLADLVRELAATRRGHARLGDQEPAHGCSPAGNPAGRSAPSGSPNGSGNSGCAPAKPAPPSGPQPAATPDRHPRQPRGSHHRSRTRGLGRRGRRTAGQPRRRQGQTRPDRQRYPATQRRHRTRHARLPQDRRPHRHPSHTPVMMSRVAQKQGKDRGRACRREATHLSIAR